MQLIKILLCLMFLSLPYSCDKNYAGTIDPNIPDAKYIEFGDKFYCIAKLCGSYNDDTLFCASSVIIDDHHILTAAHVVKNYKTCDVILKDKKYKLSQIIIHKDFETDGIGFADIAIGYSKDKFNLDYYPPLYEEQDETNKLCTISGYGLTGTFLTGTVKHDNKRRAGSNKVDFVYKDLLICTPTQHNMPDHTSLEFFIGSGDSGGGLFIKGKLAGINSCVMATKRAPKSKYGEESGHTRVSKFVEWIDESKKKMASTSD